jgi:methylenetetrahydrofolate dehydrogenase (NADP+)/methenyltetrahydrofolate cyclohydrolase
MRDIVRKIEKKSTTKLGICQKIHTIRAFYPITKSTMIIDGRSIAQDICENLGEEGKTLPRKPKLSVILVGENPASLSYIRQKERFAGIAGIDFELRQLRVDIGENELIGIVREVNENRSID